MMGLRKNVILRSRPFETPPAAAPQDKAGRAAGISPALYRFDIVLQGEGETAFRDI
jgi:hypothetical protein